MIFLIIGKSGSGKSTIINNLKQENIIPKINIIKSYTTRKQRDSEDIDHTFIQKKDIRKYRKDIVASSWIDDEFYFATSKQFKPDVANIYIVDEKGIQDMKKHYKKCIVIQIQTSKDYDINEDRKVRLIDTIYKDANCTLINDGTVEQAVDIFAKIINAYWSDF